MACRCHFPGALGMEILKWRQQNSQISIWGNNGIRPNPSKGSRPTSVRLLQSFSTSTTRNNRSLLLTESMIFVTVLYPCEEKTSAFVFKVITHLNFLASVLYWASNNHWKPVCCGPYYLSIIVRKLTVVTKNSNFLGTDLVPHLKGCISKLGKIFNNQKWINCPIAFLNSTSIY